MTMDQPEKDPRNMSTIRVPHRNEHPSRSSRLCGALLVAALSTATASFAVGTSAPPASAEVLPVASGLIVGLVDGATIDDVNARQGTITIESLPALDAYLVDWNDARPADVVEEQLALDVGVDFVNPNRTVRTAEVAFSGRIYKWASAEPGAEVDQWASPTLGLGAAHAVTTGAGITVAIIDTGIDFGDPDLAGVIGEGVDFVDGDVVPSDDRNGIDENSNGDVDEAAGHGTFVAGLVHLVAPSAELMPVRVLDSDGNTDTFTLATAMVWAADHGADVVNLSLGQSGSSTLLKDAVDLLWSRGVLSVGAAGNEARSRDSFPGAAKCAIDVTSTGRTDLISSFASTSSNIDVAAPGEDMVSNFPFSGTGVASWSGTSMSAPLVAGEAALLRSMRPDLSLGTIARLVVRTGPLAAGAAGSIKGIRRIDVAAAVQRGATAPHISSDCLQ
jgi:thermitase